MKGCSPRGRCIFGLKPWISFWFSLKNGRFLCKKWVELHYRPGRSYNPVCPCYPGFYLWFCSFICGWLCLCYSQLTNLIVEKSSACSFVIHSRMLRHTTSPSLYWFLKIWQLSYSFFHNPVFEPYLASLFSLNVLRLYWIFAIYFGPL